MTQQRQKILVIGEDTRSFLSVIRSLGMADYIVDVICYDQCSPSLKSRYIRNSYILNYQAYTSEQWLEGLIELAQLEQYQAIVPCDERAIFPLHQNKKRFPSDTVLAIPNEEVINNLFDKFRTKNLAEKEGIAHVAGRLINLQTASYQQLRAEFGEKFVIKPTLSFKFDVLSIRHKVVIVESEAAYLAWRHYSDLTDEYLVESYFFGVGEGLSLLAIEGKVLTYFAHQRVNEPRAGGGSSYRKSIKINEDMAEACAKLCRATNYTGVGMFEFKKNYQTGQWILIEVNARFWGSLPLAIYAGVNFPAIYIDAILNKNRYVHQSFTLTQLAQNHYKLDVYARSLINDIFDIKKEFEFNLVNSSKTTTILDLASRLLSFRRILFGKECIDSYQSSDTAPFKTEVLHFYQSTLVPKLPWRKKPKKNKLMANLLECLQYRTNPSIKIICYGNIMRSPFAHNYLKKICNKRNLTWIIESYGFHQKEERKCPIECVKIGLEMGVDLSLHRSKWFRQEHISDEDIIFIFDDLNREKINK